MYFRKEYFLNKKIIIAEFKESIFDDNIYKNNKIILIEFFVLNWSICKLIKTYSKLNKYKLSIKFYKIINILFINF